MRFLVLIVIFGGTSASSNLSINVSEDVDITLSNLIIHVKSGTLPNAQGFQPYEHGAARLVALINSLKSIATIGSSKVPVLDPYKIATFPTPINLQHPESSLSAEVELGHLVVRGIRKLKIQHLALQSDKHKQNFILHFKLSVPSLFIKVNFKSDINVHMIPLTLDGSARSDLTDISISGKLGAETMKFDETEVLKINSYDIYGHLGNVKIRLKTVDIEGLKSLIESLPDTVKIETVFEANKNILAGHVSEIVINLVNTLLSNYPKKHLFAK